MIRRHLIVQDSSNVEAIGYDPGELVLEVRFRGRPTLYRYAPVPWDVMLECMNAESVGRYVAKEIAGRYGTEKVEPASPGDVSGPAAAERR